MTVAELIRELQAMPQHMSVRVVLGSIYLAAENGECEMQLDDAHAMASCTGI